MNCIAAGPGQLQEAEERDTAGVSRSERPEILLNPKDQINCKPGSRIEFTISVTSDSASFQWYFQGNIIDVDNSDYTGATEKILVILECLSVHQGQYKCVVTDRSGQTRTDSNTACLVLGMYACKYDKTNFNMQIS